MIIVRPQLRVRLQALPMLVDDVQYMLATKSQVLDHMFNHRENGLAVWRGISVHLIPGEA